MNDWRGTPLEVGSNVVYATITGLVLEGTVLKLDPLTVQAEHSSPAREMDYRRRWGGKPSRPDPAKVTVIPPRTTKEEEASPST